MMVGDEVAIYFQGVYRIARIEKLNELFAWAGGIKFNRSTGREVNALLPAYMSEPTQEVRDIIEYSDLHAKLVRFRWEQCTLDTLRRAWQVVQEDKHVQSASSN
jgi:hypothetical protein